jgi:hypothetical protein
MGISQPPSGEPPAPTDPGLSPSPAAPGSDLDPDGFWDWEPPQAEGWEAAPSVLPGRALRRARGPGLWWRYRRLPGSTQGLFALLAVVLLASLALAVDWPLLAGGTLAILLGLWRLEPAASQPGVGSRGQAIALLLTGSIVLAVGAGLGAGRGHPPATRRDLSGAATRGVDAGQLQAPPGAGQQGQGASGAAAPDLTTPTTLPGGGPAPAGATARCNDGSYAFTKKAAACTRRGGVAEWIVPPTTDAPTTTAPAGATALCNDGSYSFAAKRSAACRNNGGIKTWLG